MPLMIGAGREGAHPGMGWSRPRPLIPMHYKACSDDFVDDGWSESQRMDPNN